MPTEHVEDPRKVGYRGEIEEYQEMFPLKQRFSSMFVIDASHDAVIRKYGKPSGLKSAKKIIEYQGLFELRFFQ